MDGRAIRVLICDDEASARLTLSRWLAHQPAIEVVAQAESGEEALHLLDLVPTDVLVLDVLMPGGLSGLEVARRVRDAGNRIPILFISAAEHLRDELSTVQDALFLSKGAGPAAITDAIRQVGASNL